MNQSKQEWRAAMSEAVATVVSTATAAIRVAEANVRRARRAADCSRRGSAGNHHARRVRGRSYPRIHRRPEHRGLHLPRSG